MTFCCWNSLLVLNRMSATLKARSYFSSALMCWYALSAYPATRSRCGSISG
jgi:hypothetical protein